MNVLVTSTIDAATRHRDLANPTTSTSSIFTRNLLFPRSLTNIRRASRSIEKFIIYLIK